MRILTVKGVKKKCPNYKSQYKFKVSNYFIHAYNAKSFHHLSLSYLPNTLKTVYNKDNESLEKAKIGQSAVDSML